MNAEQAEQIVLEMKQQELGKEGELLARILVAEGFLFLVRAAYVRRDADALNKALRAARLHLPNHDFTFGGAESTEYALAVGDAPNTDT